MTGTGTAQTVVEVAGLAKRFILHTQGGVELCVLGGVDLTVDAGECVAIHGPSGAGKSTLLRLIYGNYRADGGEIRVRHNGSWVQIAGAEPRVVLALRKRTLGYVSQFLRAIPRVSAVDIVAEPLLALGEARAAAQARAKALLERVNIPERLWSLAPATFSGGEQQRVNIARGFAYDYPVLLLDEPTASLDAQNRDVVVSLIREARERGAAVIGIFHDRAIRSAVADRVCEIQSHRTAA